MRKKHLTLGLLFLIFSGIGGWLYWPIFSGTLGAETIEQKREAPYFMPNNQSLALVLQAIVDPNGLVHYQRVTPPLREALEAYLKQVALATPAQFPSSAHRLAFYLNAYNALVINSVLDQMPISSVSDAGPLQLFFRQRTHIVAGRKVSLHGFETKVIRKYNPLLHFGLNCASISCPPLATAPYEAQHLDQQLKAATIGFLADTRYNYYDPQSQQLHLSKIFEWYLEDFGGMPGLRKLLETYGPQTWPAQAKIRYQPYDWNLNQADILESP